MARRVSESGGQGLLSRPVPGRPPKLTPTQEKIVRRWLPGSPTGARVRDRVVDRLPARPTDRGGVRHPVQLSVSQHVAAGPGVHPPEAATRPVRARPEGDRRVAGVRLAAHQKKARRQGAHIALIDESGLMMGPLLRRTWSPKGQTPALAQGGAQRKKVSVAAAVWLSPRRDHLGLYSHTLADGYFDNWYVTAFLEAMLRDLPGRFVVVWDGGTMHKGEPIRALEAQFADRLSLEQVAAVGADAQPGRSRCGVG